MEALNQRLDLMDEQMEELEKENAGLKKEISLLKKQNIDHQDELSAVKTRLNSLDRKFKIKSQQETPLFTSLRLEQDGELSDIKIQVKSLKKKITGLEKSRNPSSAVSVVTCDDNDKRLANLEQQVNGIVALQKLLNKMHLNLQSKNVLEKELHDLKRRFEKLEFVHDIQTKDKFLADLTSSKGFSDQLTRLDRCMEQGGNFNKDSCTFSVQKFAFSNIWLQSNIEDGEIELYLGKTFADSVLISSSDQWKGFRAFTLMLNPCTWYSFFAKSISGNPKGHFTVVLSTNRLMINEEESISSPE